MSAKFLIPVTKLLSKNLTDVDSKPMVKISNYLALVLNTLSIIECVYSNHNACCLSCYYIRFAHKSVAY